MVPVSNFLRADLLLLSTDGDRCAMHIAPGDHQHLVAFHAMVAGEYIGGKIGTGEMTQMQWPVSVGPRDSYKNVLRHDECILPQNLNSMGVEVTGRSGNRMLMQDKK